MIEIVVKNKKLITHKVNLPADVQVGDEIAGLVLSFPSYEKKITALRVVARRWEAAKLTYVCNIIKEEEL